MFGLDRDIQPDNDRGLNWPLNIHNIFTGELVQVASVCYRLKGDEPEFLLVRTRSGRWTFPKGGVDDDATHADAAAREAFEEAPAIPSTSVLEAGNFCKLMLRFQGAQEQS